MAFFIQGKEEGSLISRLRPYPDRYKKGSIKKISRNKIKYKVDISDYLPWRLYYGTINHSEEALYSLVKSDMFIVDVGANIGELSMNFAQLVGEKGKVYSFEPDSRNYQTFITNLSLNTFTSIYPFQLALSEDCGIGYMNISDPTNLGMNYITLGKDVNNENIEITTLDVFFKKNNISKLDLIKIDTEGHELKVLKGAKETLMKFHPILFVELNDQFIERAGSTALELIIFLEDLGYSIQEAVEKTVINRQSNLKNIHFDIIAIHTSVYRNL